MQPFLMPPARWPRRPAWMRWRRWIPLLAILGLLALAPVIAYSQGVDTVVVKWTAPGDDGTFGTATLYDLRMSESPITSASFDSATRVLGLPAPAGSGTQQRVTVHGLSRGTVYYFAIRTVDDAGNWSGMSNVLQWDWSLDTAPPAAPSGVNAQVEGSGVRVRWNANSEPDLAGYTVYRATALNGPYTALNANLIGATEYLDAALPAGATMVWYRVTASDQSGNESARSAAFALLIPEVPNPPTPPTSAVESVLEPGFPNPSSGSSPVSIPIVVQDAGLANAVVDVLDSGGRRVRRIELGAVGPGRQDVVWDGKNDAGRLVAPGVYRAWLIAGSTRSSIRLVRTP